MNPRTCSKSIDGRHNFAITGADCINGCGVNQSVLSGNVQKIDHSLASNVSNILNRQHRVSHRIHSELHELVDKMRKDFGEKAIKGKGSFGFYLKLLKPIPISILYQWLSDIKDSPKLDSPIARAKVFWWKFKEYKNSSKNNAK